MTMDKNFDPAAVESRIAAQWDAHQCFKAGRPERREADAFSIVIPPPNVTGSLHMGHALNHTLQDILARFERMRGKDVLWQPGTDHAGIATQMVVERKLAETQQPGRRELGREKFLEKVWEQKQESEKTILAQLQRLGASCDWSRNRFTMDEGLSQAVLKVFVDLYREGLIYRDKRLVNWDPKFQTAISDLEVVQVEVKSHLWHFNYPVDGVAYNPEDPATFITVATTRPETMLGDSAVAVHPDDERWKPLVGKMVRLPLVGRLIPVVADDYSDPEKGSGAVKITPAHDFNDFEVGRRHKLAVINVMDVEGKMALQDNENFLADLDVSALAATLALHGADRFVARKKIVAMMEEGGFLNTIEPNVHMVPHGDRSNVPIEPFLTDQWYVNVKPLAQKAMAAVRSGETRFVPENWEKTYFQWLENIEPWCISRQLWWGHQIPAWYGPDGHVFVAHTEEEAAGDALAHYVESGVLTDFEGADLARDPDKLREFLQRDEDVLDTWFSSALWPYSTLGWPDETPELKRYYPTSVLVTGFDIIFFWVARMMMTGIHFMKEVPFRDVYIHALVRDEKGAKMSKSKGNVIDPLDLIEKHGADALRFTLSAMAAQGRDIKLAVSRVEGYKAFATKLWNAARFAEMNGCVLDPAFDPAKAQETLNRWALGEYQRAARDISAAIETYRFNDAANAAYRFVWNIFCDWYLELSKPVLLGEDTPARQETRASIAFIMDEICKLLHPFMPFITEELWAIKGADSGGRAAMLALTPWPQPDGLENLEAEKEIGFVVDLVSEIRSVRAEINVPAGAQLPLVLV
ncbi:MAG: valine--tRNA ligase, partial [Beijerinckiaceae bacterium]